jgi:hypothetical protein
MGHETEVTGTCMFRIAIPNRHFQMAGTTMVAARIATFDITLTCHKEAVHVQYDTVYGSFNVSWNVLCKLIL